MKERFKRRGQKEEMEKNLGTDTGKGMKKRQ